MEQQLGQYEIVEQIGQGGMAAVYRAYQPNMRRYVAVKVILGGMVFNQDMRERFVREAQLVVKLEHPHILPVYDYNADHNPPYIVMRYLEGTTIEQVMHQTDVPLQETAFMLNQIGAALDYSHRRGVIHRDIKPSNIMLDPQGNAYLMDFGIARQQHDDRTQITMSGMFVGTPAYMSPEQASGNRAIDARTDIYSLGVMLYQLATGQLPFEGDSATTIMYAHMHTPPTPPSELNPHLSPEVDAVILKALAKSPDERYASAHELSLAFTQAVGGAAPLPTVLRDMATQSAAQMWVNRDDSKHQTGRTYSSQVSPDNQPTGALSTKNILWGVLALLIPVLGTLIALGIRDDNIEPPASVAELASIVGTDTPDTANLTLTAVNVELVNANATLTAQVTDTATLVPSATVNNEPTNTAPPPVPTDTSVPPTNTPVPATSEPTLLPVQIASRPVYRNNDWSPVEQNINGVPMVLVPAGCFNMGGNNQADEAPIHQQCFDMPFWIDKYEITRSAYQECVDAGACDTVSTRSGLSADTQPVTYIQFYQINNYCQWRGAYLPDEREWEYAARGPDNLKYTWGNTWQEGYAAYGDNSDTAMPVGSYPNGVSWVGAHDMLGNVWEFTSSGYEEGRITYPYDSTASLHSLETLNPRPRAIRGGSYQWGAQYIYTYNRSYSYIGSTDFDIGGRCASMVNPADAVIPASHSLASVPTQAPPPAPTIPAVVPTPTFIVVQVPPTAPPQYNSAPQIQYSTAEPNYDATWQAEMAVTQYASQLTQQAYSAQAQAAYEMNATLTQQAIDWQNQLAMQEEAARQAEMTRQAAIVLTQQAQPVPADNFPAAANWDINLSPNSKMLADGSVESSTTNVYIDADLYRSGSTLTGNYTFASGDLACSNASISGTIGDTTIQWVVTYSGSCCGGAQMRFSGTLHDDGRGFSGYIEPVVPPPTNCFLWYADVNARAK